MDKSVHSAEIDFRLLFESVPGLFLVLTPQLTIIAVSDAYLDATKTKRKKIIGKYIFDVFTDNTDDPASTGVANLRASLNNVLKTKKADVMAVQKYDIQLPEEEGGGFKEKHWSPVNSPVLNSRGEVVYIIHRVEDVTEFIQLKQRDNEQHQIAEQLKTRAGEMESEIYRRAQQLQEANKQLQEAERMKSEFFANVSHELRTPLSLILAPLETILTGKAGALNQQQSGLIQTVHNNTIRLLQMVNGLLDFAKFEAGKMKAEPEPTDIGGLVRSILIDFQPLIKTKEIKVSYVADFSNSYIMIDRYLFERILFNLLSNAVKFTPDKGKMLIKISTGKGKLSLSIEDTGIGISEENQQHLFKKFCQAEGSSTRRYEGTGLGLAIVKEFCELMGGTILVKSTLGKGSTFTINCPAPCAEAAKIIPGINLQRAALNPQYQPSSAKSADQEMDKEKNIPAKVLICEDNTELAIYINSLINYFCETRVAADGEQGLALVKSWMPDLVLTDVMMPKKDGIEVCKAIKADPETSKITVVLLTALTHREAMLKGWEAKADEYLFKPFHPEELVTRIRSLLAMAIERRQNAEIMTQKNKALAYANGELEAFSYSVSHDLRAPLRAIFGYTKILSDNYMGRLDEEAIEMMDNVMNNVKKMGQLIDDLLAFARVGKKEMLKTTINMAHVVQKTLMELKHSASFERTKFNILPLPPAWGDYSMIGQVFTNLISNAIKYSQTKDEPVIEIGTFQKDGNDIYYVKDNGVGFEMKYYNKLFGIFQRLHSFNDFEGNGVGLALVKRIIIKHGGNVWAEAEPGRGATFYFYLPR